MSSALSKKALRILNAALNAADPTEAVLRHVRLDGQTLIAGRQRYGLKKFRNVYVVGAGKAAAAMALAIEELLSKRISGGFINVKSAPNTPLRRFQVMGSGHPIPHTNGEKGARCIAEIPRGAQRDDLEVCLISG